MLSGFV